MQVIDGVLEVSVGNECFISVLLEEGGRSHLSLSQVLLYFPDGVFRFRLVVFSSELCVQELGEFSKSNFPSIIVVLEVLTENENFVRLEVELLVLEHERNFLGREEPILVLVNLVKEDWNLEVPLLDLGGKRLDQVFDSNRERALLGLPHESLHKLLLSQEVLVLLVEVLEKVLCLESSCLRYHLLQEVPSGEVN